MPSADARIRGFAHARPGNGRPATTGPPMPSWPVFERFVVLAAPTAAFCKDRHPADSDATRVASMYPQLSAFSR
jgi:hypothetical protein